MKRAWLCIGIIGGLALAGLASVIAWSNVGVHSSQEKTESSLITSGTLEDDDTVDNTDDFVPTLDDSVMKSRYYQELLLLSKLQDGDTIEVEGLDCLQKYIFNDGIFGEYSLYYGGGYEGIAIYNDSEFYTVDIGNKSYTVEEDTDLTIQSAISEIPFNFIDACSYISYVSSDGDFEVFRQKGGTVEGVDDNTSLIIVEFDHNRIILREQSKDAEPYMTITKRLVSAEDKAHFKLDGFKKEMYIVDSEGDMVLEGTEDDGSTSEISDIKLSSDSEESEVIDSVALTDISEDEVLYPIDESEAADLNSH